jgi:ABC-2 type transport system permease protein
VSRWRSIWLVARREILERGRSRGFVFSVLFTTAIIVGSFTLPAILFGPGETARIGVVRPEPPALQFTLRATASQFQFGRDIEFVPFGDRTAGEAALADGEVEVLLDIPADLSGPGETIFDRGVGMTMKNLVDTAVVAMRTNAVLTEAGVDTTALEAAQTPTAAVELDPREEGSDATFLVANIGAVLILIGVFSFGFTVLSGVVEEKQSRVVEVVLSTVRPRDLLIGKVLGIGILGLIQLAVFLVAGLGVALATQDFTLPATTPTAIVQLVIWFALGYVLYSTALGVLGALASRMEEASNVSTPVTMIAITSYFIALFGVLNDPAGVLARVVTFVPPVAPMVVPLRAAFGAIELWEVVASVAITVVAIYALFVIGGRIYSGAALQTGGRMKLRDAWRSAGE